MSKRQVEEEKDKQACEERYVRGRLVRHTLCVETIVHFHVTA